MKIALQQLKKQLVGDLYTENVQRVLYATDASQYREIPLAVTRPKDKEDIKKILAFAHKHKTSIIPRGAGTSLAGQVVGAGIVVDVSKYMNKILEINPKEKYAMVEPGVVLAELNMAVAKYGLQFGPETSTANRCVIGGMLGNNSCGLHSLAYGSVREHILEVDALLSDGSEVTFKALSKAEFEEKRKQENSSLERAIYQHIWETLSNTENQENIRTHFPEPSLTRRNMGYAIDALLDSEIFTKGGTPFNFCKLLAGSEGTLTVSHRIKVNLIPLPPKHRGIVCAHFDTLEEALEANLIALKYKPIAIELMDDIILECTKDNIEQRKNRFFVQGNPGAILMIEFAEKSAEMLQNKADTMEKAMREAQFGYHFPLVVGDENIKKVWALRTAGLGLLSNVPGDRKGVPGIEDVAVIPENLPAYIADLKVVLSELGLSSIYYAHIGTGEIHTRPLINFKDPKDVERFDKLMNEVAILTKKHRGSMSGEHGDGRVRGKFIPFMLGEHNYQIIKELKRVWDTHNILNPGKIIDTPSIIEDLRVVPGKETPSYETIFDFTRYNGYFRTIEKCNGTGDCRKNSIIGGSMCPTYMATRDEDKTTRGRANILREYLYASQKKNPFDHKEIYDILSLCISCKACKSECPANVDMTKLKAEFLQHYYDIHGIPLRSKLVAYLPRLNQLAVLFRPISNLLINSIITKKIVGIAPNRNLPTLSKITTKKWFGRHNSLSNKKTHKRVYLFADEFTNFNESELGIKAIQLLTALGYEVKIPKHIESGRTFLSKGLIRTAQNIATKNVKLLKDIVTEKTPLVGIEPSTILTFRDEYPDLVTKELQEEAVRLGKNALLFEEFIAREIKKGTIKVEQFTTEKKVLLLHGHCQQKSIASTSQTKEILSLPKNYTVTEIPSGCCGMAGSFGYEKEHYDLSMRIGEMVLFPAIREATEDTTIVASGTSCRHQIKDGANRKALHPIEVLYDAMV